VAGLGAVLGGGEPDELGADRDQVVVGGLRHASFSEERNVTDDYLASPNVPDYSYGSITVPSGKLQDLWQVRWRARATAGGAAGAWSDWQTIKIDISKPSVTDLDVSPSTVVNSGVVACLSVAEGLVLPADGTGPR
jgi:hypothetical protein